jgi:hypothetical protein
VAAVRWGEVGAGRATRLKRAFINIRYKKAAASVEANTAEKDSGSTSTLIWNPTWLTELSVGCLRHCYFRLQGAQIGWGFAGWWLFEQLFGFTPAGFGQLFATACQ